MFSSFDTCVFGGRELFGRMKRSKNDVEVKVFMHEAKREKTWEPGSKRRGCDGLKEELRKLGYRAARGVFVTFRV